MKTLLFLSFLALCAASCSGVRSKQLVGAKPVDITPEDGGPGLEGEWVDKEGKVIGSVKVTDARNGEILFMPRKEEGKKQGEDVKLRIRCTGDDVFLNSGPDGDGEFHWYLMKHEAGQLIFWEPDNAAFRKLVAGGRIRGKNDPEYRKGPDGGRIRQMNPGTVVDDPEGAWVGKMVAGEFGMVYDWKNPIVLRLKAKPGK